MSLKTTTSHSLSVPVNDLPPDRVIFGESFAMQVVYLARPESLWRYLPHLYLSWRFHYKLCVASGRKWFGSRIPTMATYGLCDSLARLPSSSRSESSRKENFFR